MNTAISLRISSELVRCVREIADGMHKNIRSDPARFYVEYYLCLPPHLQALFSIGTYLGFKGTDRILEIGSGLGTRCLLGKALWGADFTGLEPCANTYASLSAAIREFKKCNPSLPYELVTRPGEDTGLAGGRFDFVVSSEVLEHVQDPGKVIREAYRVLRPGGTFFFSTCNYRSFYEGHYRCPWLPFLTKRTARTWVRLLGYNPAFVDEINFITRPQLAAYLKRAGFKAVELNFSYPHPAPPALTVELPEDFDPRCKTRRSFFWGRAIQHPITQKALSLAAMEYKLWGIAKK